MNSPTIISNALTILLTLVIVSCSFGRKGGTIPVYQDQYVLTTNERFFKLEDTLFGIVLFHQKAYPCDIDTIICNSTTIIELVDGDTITVHTPCNIVELRSGDIVTITPLEYDQTKHWNKREILKQFPKKSQNYPYYQCISCLYKNTVGKITFANVYMKRFVLGPTSKSVVTTEDKFPAYDNKLPLSFASYTLDR